VPAEKIAVVPTDKFAKTDGVFESLLLDHWRHRDLKLSIFFFSGWWRDESGSLCAPIPLPPPPPSLGFKNKTVLVERAREKAWRRSEGGSGRVPSSTHSHGSVRHEKLES